MKLKELLAYMDVHTNYQLFCYKPYDIQNSLSISDVTNDFRRLLAEDESSIIVKNYEAEIVTYKVVNNIMNIYIIPEAVN